MQNINIIAGSYSDCLIRRCILNGIFVCFAMEEDRK